MKPRDIKNRLKGLSTRKKIAIGIGVGTGALVVLLILVL